MRCPSCHHENPGDAKFCLNCGAQLAQVCPQCASAVPLEAKFCMACGQALRASPPTEQPPAPSAPQKAKQPIGEPETARPVPHEAERRQLTVMFCDLVGSTALSEQLDPEELREVLRAYQDVCHKVIGRFEGHVARYFGDGLLVFFGYPQAHEDDAQRAVRSGLGIVQAMERLNRDLRKDAGVRLDVRIGTHTGLVVARDMDEDRKLESMAIVGETPNVAARLQACHRTPYHEELVNPNRYEQ